ncbi:MAG: hypothetical protein ACE15D_04120 [Candidatus Eisenbacteria bacterium]
MGTVAGGRGGTVEALASARVQTASLAILVLLAGVAAASHPISSGDLWVSLGCGRWILSHGVGSIDPFSFTSPAGAWVNQNWGSHALLALLYGAGGTTALGLWKIAVATAVLALLASTARRLGSGNLLAAAGVLGAAAVLRSTLDVRANPHSILLAAILGRWIAGLEQRTARELLFAPALLLLWANLHGGFLFGIAALAAAAGGTLLAHAIEKRPARAGLLPLALPFAGMVAAIASPYGIRNLTHPYAVTVGPEAHYWRDVIEWRSPLAPQALHEPGVLGFWILLAGLLAAVALGALLPARRGESPRSAERRPSLLPLVCVALLALLLALASRRFAPLFAVTALPATLGFLGRRWRAPRIPAAAVLALPALALAGTGIDFAQRLVLGNALWPRSVAWPSRLLRVDEQPEEATAFLVATGVSGRVLTDWTWGGYLLFRAPLERDGPRYRIYIDGRAQAAYPASVARDLDAARLAADAGDRQAVEAFLDTYAIDVCLLDRRGGSLPLLVPQLAGWSGFYADDEAVLAARGPAAARLAAAPAAAWKDPAIREASRAFRERTAGSLDERGRRDAFEAASSSVAMRPTTTGVTEMVRLALAAPEPIGRELRARAARACEQALAGEALRGAPESQRLTIEANAAQSLSALRIAEGDRAAASALRERAARDADRARRLAARMLR